MSNLQVTNAMPAVDNVKDFAGIGRQFAELYNTALAEQLKQAAAEGYTVDDLNAEMLVAAAQVNLLAAVLTELEKK